MGGTAEFIAYCLEEYKSSKASFSLMSRLFVISLMTSGMSICKVDLNWGLGVWTYLFLTWCRGVGIPGRISCDKFIFCFFAF